MRSRILGTGHFVPPRVVKNQDLEAQLETSHDWIVQRTGIHERRYVDPGMGTADMGVEAAKQALAAAKLTPADLDYIIFATLSSDYEFPGSGVFVQEKLGCDTIGALDVRNQCSGFLYSLQIADSLIRTGTYRNILIIGSEIHSTGLDFSKRGRDVTVIFGDGAGAVVLGPSENDDRGLLATSVHSEGKHARRLWCELPGSIYHDRFGEREWWGEPGRQYPKMEGKYVFMHAVTRLPEVMHETLQKAGLHLEDVDLIVPHQANLRINQKVAEVMGIPEEKFVHNIQRYGNTTAASIPIAMDEAVRDGRITPGKIVLLAAFGAGFTWGGAVMRW